jgi:hypothetical protein
MLGWVVRGLGMISKDSRSAFFAVASAFVADVSLVSYSAGATAQGDEGVCGDSKVTPRDPNPDHSSAPAEHHPGVALREK